jgi:potassium efflux system protein
MPIDKGQRYAAGMILRYLLTVTTVAMACLTIGLSWSSIQWLLAAMTVGLGFGLQEIFANLVSGLIILFERPIRVGDLVTVGGVSGRVTRMQIRATTITGFDRRELIVPNKKFITEDVMNWTLTDDVNRIEIQVGVAYGSDTDLVRQILLRVARQQPQVLADPEPLATFDRFADSSLNFTMRCFLPNLDDRLTVIHELHSAIDREFRKARIEIAFPQQDLHVRTVDAPLTKLLSGDHQSQKGAA